MAIWELSPFASQLWHSSFESLPKGQLSVQLSKPHPIWNNSVERGYSPSRRTWGNPSTLSTWRGCCTVLMCYPGRGQGTEPAQLVVIISALWKSVLAGESPVFLQLKRLFLSLEFLAFVRSQHQCWSGTGNLLLQHLIIPPIKLSEVI